MIGPRAAAGQLRTPTPPKRPPQAPHPAPPPLRLPPPPRQANWLRGQGVTKGDAVLIYMPMVRWRRDAEGPTGREALLRRSGGQGAASEAQLVAPRTQPPADGAGTGGSNRARGVTPPPASPVALLTPHPRPQVCELPIAMLACARIGAVHSVVFAGFSAESMAQRIQDCRRAKSARARRAALDRGLNVQARAGLEARRARLWVEAGPKRAAPPPPEALGSPPLTHGRAPRAAASSFAGRAW